MENKVGIRGGSQLAELYPDANAAIPDVGFETFAQDHPISWYALRTRYRFEKKVAEQLQGKAIETFLPVRGEFHRWSDRHKKIRVPLFPGYVFVRVSQAQDSRLRVLRTIGVIDFVSSRGEALPIPPIQIENLRLVLSRKVPCSLHPFLTVGQRVRIRGGCLHGLEGILIERGERRLVISIETIQRSVAIELRGYELEPA